MSELACAAFAAATATHVVRVPRSAEFRAFCRSFDEQGFLGELARGGFRWVARSDPSFPGLLQAIHDPPPGLFVRGAADVALLGALSVAVVGARVCSGYGSAVAEAFGRRLAESGVVVVSGLARGVDAASHRGALAAAGLSAGRTVAVLGCGIDRDYPRAHAALAARIAERGLIVSEYAPGVAPAPWRFPARNRIVAGLAAATVVVEARERSGALITADLAMEEGREVLAVPGEITSALSRGTNALLRAGAGPATCAEDVLEAIGIDREARPAPPPLDPAGAAVLAAIGDGIGTLDEVVRATSLGAAKVATAATRLELDGRIVTADGIYREVMR